MSEYTLYQRWRCLKSNCCESVGLPDRMIFNQTFPQTADHPHVLYWWVHQYPVTDAEQEVEMQEKSTLQVYQYLRDIYSWHLRNGDAPLMLGGPGVIMQVSESLFRHKPKRSKFATVFLSWVILHPLRATMGVWLRMKSGCGHQLHSSSGGDGDGARQVSTAMTSQTWNIDSVPL